MNEELRLNRRIAAEWHTKSSEIFFIASRRRIQAAQIVHSPTQLWQLIELISKYAILFRVTLPFVINSDSIEDAYSTVRN